MGRTQAELSWVSLQDVVHDRQVVAQTKSKSFQLHRILIVPMARALCFGLGAWFAAGAHLRVSNSNLDCGKPHSFPPQNPPSKIQSHLKKSPARNFRCHGASRTSGFVSQVARAGRPHLDSRYCGPLCFWCSWQLQDLWSQGQCDPGDKMGEKWRMVKCWAVFKSRFNVNLPWGNEKNLRMQDFWTSVFEDFVIQAINKGICGIDSGVPCQNAGNVHQKSDRQFFFAHVMSGLWSVRKVIDSDAAPHHLKLTAHWPMARPSSPPFNVVNWNVSSLRVARISLTTSIRRSSGLSVPRWSTTSATGSKSVRFRWGNEPKIKPWSWKLMSWRYLGYRFFVFEA